MKVLSWIMAGLLVLGLLPQAMAVSGQSHGSMVEAVATVHDTGGAQATDMDIACDHGCQHCVVCAAVVTPASSTCLPMPHLPPLVRPVAWMDRPLSIDTPPPQARA